MKVIGVYGKSGAGKTTLSKMIQAYDEENIEIIHLDNIFDGIKKKFFKRNITQKTDADENKIVTVNPNLKSRILKNKIGNFFMKKRNLLGNVILKNKIAKAKKDGKRAIIIEGIHLNNFKITEGADTIIRVEAPFIERLHRVRKREKEPIDKSKMVFLDKVFFKGKKSRYKYLVENNGDIENLRMQAKQIYDKELADRKPKISWKEKYKAKIQDAISSVYRDSIKIPKRGGR